MKFRKSLILFIGCLLLSTTGALAQSEKQKELEEKRQAILQEIKQINSLLFKTRGEKKSVLTEVEDLNQRISARENLIRVTNQQANLLTREINENLNKMEQLRNELKELKEDYAAMINKSYKSKSDQSRIMFLLSSENFLQAYKRLQYMKQYAKHRKEQGESIKEKTIQLQILNTSLIDQKNKKQLLIEENKLAKINLTKEKKDQESLIASLKKDESKFVTQVRSKQREAEKVDREIEALIRAAIAESNSKAGNSPAVTKSSSGFAMTAEATTLAANFTSNKGKLPWPVERGVLVGRYGKHPHPQFPNVTLSNNGVEIATERNSQARAVFEGEVFKIQEIKGANKAVWIRHGNYITIYRNLVDLKVKNGDKVSTKQVLGTVFFNPVAGKAILKFYVFQNTNKMNPADWVYKM
ncbi:murein hydrolase activator EnvC family protein [Constantimarinum furrinae]|uniref:Membrane-bound metallopeptidase n=1 Tax=Constantimarinum furrinae TaxID=2562285 RepID=A0A7G8PSY0_9FLAO|nr:peptidoglycan DD-metalloendopeptidase family protein [Constantimarinum furrinae]QNJ97446.1 Membrane-bound metallopeptidase [Constantimarinum furrinae]